MTAGRERDVSARLDAHRVIYAPSEPGVLRAEVQRLDPAHPARRWGQHSHTDFFELLLFDAATGSHVRGSRRQEVQAGQLVALAPGEDHDFADVGDGSPWMVIFTAESVGRAAVSTVGFYDADPLMRAFTGPGPPLDDMVLSEQQNAWWQQTLTAMTREQAERGPLYGQALQSSLTLLLVEAARLAPKDWAPPADLRSMPLLEDTFAAVERLYRSGAGLAEVAAAVHRSPAHLTAFVRKHTGRTVGEWMVQRRMVDARRRLLDPHQSVAQVAADVGYRDAVHFHRQFRSRHGGTPPGAWRRQAVEPRGDGPTDPPMNTTDPL